MYITFDYKCTYCGHVESRFVKREHMDVQDCDAPCNHPMQKLPAGTRTTFKFADTKLKG